MYNVKQHAEPLEHEDPMTPTSRFIIVKTAKGLSARSAILSLLENFEHGVPSFIKSDCGRNFFFVFKLFITIL